MDKKVEELHEALVNQANRLMSLAVEVRCSGEIPKHIIIVDTSDDTGGFFHTRSCGGGDFLGCISALILSIPEDFHSKALEAITELVAEGGDDDDIAVVEGNGTVQ